MKAELGLKGIKFGIFEETKNIYTMDKEELLKKISEIDSDIAKIEYQGRKAIPDGIVDVDEYLASDLKIMWILKEVNSEDDEGEWDMRDLFKNFKDSTTNTGIKKGWGGTYLPLIYTTYGIINNKKWNDIPYIVDDYSVVEVLKKTAIVNLKKVSGLAQANVSELKSFHEEFGNTLKKQIEIYQPNVIICGGTGEFLDDLFSELFDSKYFQNQDEKSKTIFYKYDNVIIAYAYHPSYAKRQGNGFEEEYGNSIIENVLDWKNQHLK